MTDCIIVGGGLIGMLTARELNKAGARVQLIEQGTLGCESTWAGGGILSPLYPWRYPDAVTVLAKYGQRVYPELAQQLLDESGVDPEYTVNGLLLPDLEDTDEAVAWSKRWNMRLEALRSGALSQCESQLSPHFQHGLFYPGIGQMRNPRLIKALRGSLQTLAIDIREHTQVTGLIVEQDQIKGVRTADQTLMADKVVVAGGAWSRQIVTQFGQPPFIEPVKGQMIIFKGEPGLVSRIVLYHNRYLIPRRDGRILAGSTIERAGFDKQTSAQAMQALRDSAVEIAPVLANLEVEHHWSGLRPGTAQGIPYICEHEQIRGLFINSGHFRNGVVLGIASGRLMKDLVLGCSGELDPAEYSLNSPH